MVSLSLLCNYHKYLYQQALAIMQVLKNKNDWKGWLFDVIPRGFWDSHENVVQCIFEMGFEIPKQ